MHSRRSCIVGADNTRSTLRVLVVVSVAALSWCPPALAADQTARAAGSALFQRACAACHGFRGTGGRGPDLTVGAFRHVTDDASLFGVITAGVPGTAMPPLGPAYPPAAIWDLVSYVRSLSRGSASASPRGDAAAGERLFTGRGGCGVCHQPDGRGTRGPSLSDVGRRRSPEALRRALLKPERVTAEWHTLRVTDRAGTVHVGRRLDEDTYSVRLLKVDGTLRAFDRGAVRSIELVARSRMPSYASTLTPLEVEDLIAYLQSLQH